jgi:hypothetical protein
MDAHLKRLADIGLDLTAAEEALDEGANTTARDLLDRAAEALDALRSEWPALSEPERKIIGSTAAPLRQRLDAAMARLPRLVALTEVPQAERIVDPEDDGPPEAA